MDKKFKVYVIASQTIHYRVKLDSAEDSNGFCPVPIELTDEELGDFVEVWDEWERWQNILQERMGSVLKKRSVLFKADGVDDFIVE